MKTKIMIAGIMGALMLLCTFAMADYSGDHPLTHYERGGTYGDLVYVTVEDGSTYKRMYATEVPDSMSQNLKIEIPDDAEIITARLYNYVSWSTSGGPYDKNVSGDPAEATLEFNGETVTCQNPDPITNPIDYSNGVVQYWDSKEQGLTYDFPSGTFAWDVTHLIDGSDTYTAIITNADSTPNDDESFTTYGFGLLVVYDIEPEGPHPAKLHYWIMEGADQLSGTALEPATTSASFLAAVPNIKGVESATLKTVVVSCDKGGSTPPGNMVSFNGAEIGPATAGDYWSIGVDDYNVGWLIQRTGNMAEIQDRGDYMVASNAFLVVEY
jgi:hypothetical protein